MKRMFSIAFIVSTVISKGCNYIRNGPKFIDSTQTNISDCWDLCELNNACAGVIYDPSVNRCTQTTQMIVGTNRKQAKIQKKNKVEFLSKLEPKYYQERCLNGYSRRSCKSLKGCKGNRGRRGFNQPSFYTPNYCGNIQKCSKFH